MVGYLSFSFKVLLEQLLKFLLNSLNQLLTIDIAALTLKRFSHFTHQKVAYK